MLFAETNVVDWTQVIVAVISLVGVIVGTIWTHSTRKETKPNGGSSLKDIVVRVEQKVDDHVSYTKGRLDATDRRVERLEDHEMRK